MTSPVQVLHLPVHIDGIRYATAQLLARRNGKIYMMQIPGIPTVIAFENGKTMKNVKAKGTGRPIYNNVYLLSQKDAEHLFLAEEVHSDIGLDPVCTKIKEAGP